MGARHVAECVLGWLREVCGYKILVETIFNATTLSGVLSVPVRAFAGVQYVRYVTRRKCQRGPVMSSKDPIYLIPTKQRVHEAIPVSAEALTTAKWKTVYAADYQVTGDIKGGQRIRVLEERDTGILIGTIGPEVAVISV